MEYQSLVKEYRAHKSKQKDDKFYKELSRFIDSLS